MAFIVHDAVTVRAPVSRNYNFLSIGAANRGGGATDSRLANIDGTGILIGRSCMDPDRIPLDIGLCVVLKVES